MFITVSSYSHLSPTAQTSRVHIIYNIFFSPAGKEDISAFFIDSVGIIAWWSVTFELSITCFAFTASFIELKKVTDEQTISAKGGIPFSISLVKYRLSVLGYVVSFFS